MIPTCLVTGGAGFIGANLVRHLLARSDCAGVVVLDRLTYAGNLDNLAESATDPRYRFVQGDVCDRALVRATLRDLRPGVVFHLAAESHVDRSVDDPAEFVRTNVLGTFEVLDAALAYARALPAAQAARFRFVHVSTDEVCGSLGATGAFTEESPHAPSSPYAATKAGADHLVRAYVRTYGLPAVVTRCSNNYGPYQFPEKLLPLVTLNALDGLSLPVYGDGNHVRDWIHVADHCSALAFLAEAGEPGATYCIGGGNERTTLEIVHAACAALDDLAPRPGGAPYRKLVAFVADRPGHDRRYAVDASKLRALGWAPRVGIDAGIRATVAWYLEHRGWCRRVCDGVYGRERLGLAPRAPEGS